MEDKQGELMFAREISSLAESKDFNISVLPINLAPMRIEPKSQWTIENFHCKNSGSLKNKVKEPRGSNNNQEKNNTLPIFFSTIFSKITCKVTSAIMAPVK